MNRSFTKVFVLTCLLSVTVLSGSLAHVAHAAIVGVDIEAGQGSPTNWTSYTLADVGTTVTNLIAEDGSGTSLGFQLSSPGPIANQNFTPSSGAVIPTHSNDLTTVCCDIVFNGPNPTIAIWSGLVPFQTYNYWVFTSSAAPDTITVTGSTVDSFAPPGVSPFSQRINGTLGSNALTFASYARQVNASATGTIDIAILSDGTPTPSGYALQAVPTPSAMLLFGTGFGSDDRLELSKDEEDLNTVSPANSIAYSKPQI